jgi:hypothetical protein
MSNLFEAEFGGADAINEATGVRTPTTVTTRPPSPTKAPPTADAAPKIKNVTVFVGLCDALNQFQQNLVKEGTYEIADEYVIEFAPDTLKQATVALKGTTDLKSVPTQQAQTAKAQLDPATNSVDNTARIIAAAPGMPIVKFIDQVMRSSSYITDQANVTIDPVSGIATPNEGEGAAQIAWYRITLKTEQIGTEKDKKRNVYPMRMTYIINTYAINQMQSQYFPEAKPRGSHKSYEYWFTGRNTQVMGFEQEYKNTYFSILANSTDGKLSGGQSEYAGLTNERPVESKSDVPKSFSASTNQSDQGASNKANLIGASAADFLYGSTAPAEITLKIMGDPAWMQQGELSNQLTAENMSFSPFNPDGTINFEASEIKFDISWNRPADYDYQTGLVDVTAQNRDPNGTLSVLQPQARLTYVARHVKSTFSGGMFTQELQANWYANLFQEVSAKNLKTAENQRASLTNLLQLVREPDGAETFTETYTEDPTEPTQLAGPINNLAPQPASPAAPASSNGSAVLIPLDNLAQITTPQTSQQVAQAAIRFNTESQTMAAKDA